MRDCSACPVRGDPCKRLKAALKKELDAPWLESCPMFLANVVRKPDGIPVPSKKGDREVGR
jgi:hypothetical protein